ncbi:Ubiquitin family protein, partial [Globisporangium splendens]
MVEQQSASTEGGLASAESRAMDALTVSAGPVVESDAFAVSPREETIVVAAPDAEISSAEVDAIPDAAVESTIQGSDSSSNSGVESAATTDAPLAAAEASDLLRLRLKMLDERVVEVEVAASTAVAEFRVQVAHATQVPVYRQRLIYRGKLLKDGSVLSTYDIQDGHTIHLVAKPTASAAAASSSSSSSTTDAAAATVSTSTSTDDDARATWNGSRSIFANNNTGDDDDFVSTAVRRNRDHLRRLMRRVDSLERSNEGSDFDQTATRRGLRDPGVLRPQVTTRRRVPGIGDPTGDAWNMEILREALASSNANSDGSAGDSGSALRRLHGLRELFGDDVADDMSPSNIASDMGLGTRTTGSNRDELHMNLDHILQGMMTLRTVLSTVAIPPESEVRHDETVDEHVERQSSSDENDDLELNEPDAVETRSQQQRTGGATLGSSDSSRARRGRRRFFVGQWLDVKDTVNQWLECTVLDISEDKVLVHYHGWPSRWDEWIDFDSTRIAAFRTRTLHTLNAQQMSPVPTTRLPNAPSVGSQDVREMVVGVRDLMREIVPHIERFAELCEDQQSRLLQDRPRRQEGFNDGGFFDSIALQQSESESRPTSTRDDEVSEMAHLVAPLFDRFGRLLTDSARCVEPLLRPELQRHNAQQRQIMQARANAARNRTPRPPISPPSALERQDTSMSIRDLIATSNVNPNDSQSGRRNIDVHIHAIVAPSSLTSLASLARVANASILQATNSPAGSRRIRAPSTPPVGPAFEDAFGLPSLRPAVDNSDSRAILNDEDDDESSSSRRDSDESVDQSRLPLLSSFRRNRSSTSSSVTDTRRRRSTVDQSLASFLEDDFFGASEGGRESDSHDDDAAAPANSRGSSAPTDGPGFQYQPILPPSSPEERNLSTNPVRGVIPEIAEANERARERELAAASTRSAEGNNGIMRGNSSASSSSSSSSSANSNSNSTSAPSFLELMRRSLSRNFGFSSSSEENRESSERAGRETRPTTFSSSSSSSSSYPPSPPTRIADSRPAFRRLSDSSSSSVEEDMDELD